MYGLPTGTRITYGSPGFPPWVYQLANHFGLKASTYPGHQESHRNEPGFAANPQRLNRGIDWAGPIPNMQRFADYCMSVKTSLEQVIWENPNTGKRAGVAGGKDVTNTAYYRDAWTGHRDHVHTRQSAPIPLPSTTPQENPMAWTGDPTWLEEVLRPALGDRLKTLPGWQNSGHGDFRDIRGVMVHHTGNSRESAQSIRDGRPDLKGPLSNLHIAPDGTVTIVALGVCWHAGQGSYPWLPTNNANWHTIGIECAWPTITNGKYNANERWPDKQIISMRDTCAALVKKLGYGADRVIGHKEYAGAAQGKWDPGNIDMNWFRAEVKKDLDGFRFPGEQPAQPGPILPPNYEKEIWDQLRIEWPQLGGQTLVNAIAEIRDKVCGTSDKDKR